MARLKPNRGISGLRALLLTALCSMTAAGCAERHQEPRLELVSAVVQTRDGEVSMQAESLPAKHGATYWNLRLTAETGGYRLELRPFGSEARLSVFPADGGSNVSLVGVNAFYETNFREQQRFPLTAAGVAELRFPGPGPLGGLPGGETLALPADAIDVLGDYADEVHRVYFEVLVDGEPHVIDVRFRLSAVGVSA